LGFEVEKDAFRRAIRLYLSDWLRALEIYFSGAFFLPVIKTEEKTAGTLRFKPLVM